MGASVQSRLAEEAGRILTVLGAEVTFSDPRDLPLVYAVPDSHPKVHRRAASVEDIERRLRAVGVDIIKVTPRPESHAFIRDWLPGSGVRELRDLGHHRGDEAEGHPLVLRDVVLPHRSLGVISADAPLAYGELVMGFRPFVVRRVSAAANVDDVMEEVLLRPQQGLLGLQGEQRLGPWVYQVARHTIVDHRARARPSVPVGEVVEPETTADESTNEIDQQEQPAGRRGRQATGSTVEARPTKTSRPVSGKE